MFPFLSAGNSCCPAWLHSLRTGLDPLHSLQFLGAGSIVLLGEKRQQHFPLRTWWPNVAEHQWLRASHPKERQKESRSWVVFFFLLSHWILTSLWYFVLMACLLSCGPQKVCLRLPYSCCLQDPRGLFHGWIWNPLQPGQIKDRFSCSSNFKAADLCKSTVNISCSFQRIDLKSFHLNHLERMLPC